MVGLPLGRLDLSLTDLYLIDLVQIADDHGASYSKVAAFPHLSARVGEQQQKQRVR